MLAFNYFNKCLLLHCCLQVVPSVLWRCWLGGRKGIRPVKNWLVRCWCGYLSGARCRLARAQLMPLPLTSSCSSKIQIGFTFLVPAYPGSPGQRAVKRVCVCVCVCEYLAELQARTSLSHAIVCLANTLQKDGESTWNSHILACNFAKYSIV